MYTKFEEAAIQKQEQAYKESYAVFQFNKSCEVCCTYNLRSGRGTCATCPIKAAHIKAMTEIQSDLRKPQFNYGASKLRTRAGTVTLVLRSDKDVTITIK